MNNPIPASTQRRWDLERQHTKAQLIDMFHAAGCMAGNDVNKWTKEEIASSIVHAEEFRARRQATS